MFKHKHIYSLLLRLVPLVLVLPPINIKPNATEASMATLPSDLIQNLVLQHYVFTSWCIRYFLLSQKLRWIVVIALWFCCWTNLILARRGRWDEGLKERNVKKSTLTVSDILTSAKKYSLTFPFYRQYRLENVCLIYVKLSNLLASSWVVHSG